MKKLNRIYIFGTGGAGKTRLANRLSKKLKIKTYDLDKLYFLEKYDKIQGKKKRGRLLIKISSKKKWIIEGVFSKKWVESAVKKSDLILILNFHPKIIKKRILLRYLKRKFFTRRKTNFKDTIKLLKYSKKYEKGILLDQKKLAKKYNKKILVLKNKKQIGNLLNNIK